jgi:nicotinamide-nucleotide amidase
MAKKKLTLAVAESCTGGLICHNITAIPGASGVLKEGIVCYSNTSKIKRLGIDKELLLKKGAVSPEVCRYMAKNIVKSEKTDIGVSVTGISGPSGGTAQKPIGLVYIGINLNGRIKIYRHHFKGGRNTIQKKSAAEALKIIKSALAY